MATFVCYDKVRIGAYKNFKNKLKEIENELEYKYGYGDQIEGLYHISGCDHTFFKRGGYYCVEYVAWLPNTAIDDLKIKLYFYRILIKKKRAYIESKITK